MKFPTLPLLDGRILNSSGSSRIERRAYRKQTKFTRRERGRFDVWMRASSLHPLKANDWLAIALGHILVRL